MVNTKGFGKHKALKVPDCHICTAQGGSKLNGVMFVACSRNDEICDFMFCAHVGFIVP